MVNISPGERSIIEWPRSVQVISLVIPVTRKRSCRQSSSGSGSRRAIPGGRRRRRPPGIKMTANRSGAESDCSTIARRYNGRTRRTSRRDESAKVRDCKNNFTPGSLGNCLPIWKPALAHLGKFNYPVAGQVGMAETSTVAGSVAGPTKHCFSLVPGKTLCFPGGRPRRAGQADKRVPVYINTLY